MPASLRSSQSKRCFRAGVLFVLLSTAAWSQTPQDTLHSLVGQKLILRRLGDVKEAKVKKNDLAHLKGTCDLAVEVKEAAWSRGTARFRLQEVGTPSVPGKPYGHCQMVYDENSLEISGFAQDEKPDSLTASISELLQTPEQYLVAQGVAPFVPPKSDDDVVSTTPVRMGVGVTAPKTLLSVDPAFPTEARKAKIQGEVALWIVVGVDGRIHESKVNRGAGNGFDERALSVLSLWRFEPATKQGGPVAVQQNLEMSFHLY